MRRLLRYVAPLLILIAGAGVALALLSQRAEPEASMPIESHPEVRVVTVELGTLTLTVDSQGTVQPRTESRLSAEVNGRVVEVAPQFAAGGFFAAGETMLRIDPTDYEQGVTQARAEVVQAELALEQERAEREIAVAEWNALGLEGDAPPLTSRALQLRGAEARLAAAEATLARARRDLERTRVVAPYDAIVREKSVDLGQFLARGQALATIYGTEVAEVRLPLPDDELAFVDLPLAPGDARRASRPPVTLSTEFAGRSWEWQGRIVRTEGAIDATSRMVQAIAQVDDPFRPDAAGRPPLAAGLFVEATIEGRRVEEVAVIPRAALREDGRVLVVDAEERLRFREVSVLRLERERALIDAGLAAGDRVCVSSLAVAVDGMRVQVAG